MSVRPEPLRAVLLAVGENLSRRETLAPVVERRVLCVQGL
jgi:hypothetical protein